MKIYYFIHLLCHLYSGSYDSDRIKQGFGIYTWMGPTSDEDETLIEKAKYEGNYVNGQKSGIGKMTFPNGDIYEGEWADDKVMQFDSLY